MARLVPQPRVAVLPVVVLRSYPGRTLDRPSWPCPFRSPRVLRLRPSSPDGVEPSPPREHTTTSRHSNVQRSPARPPSLGHATVVRFAFAPPSSDAGSRSQPACRGLARQSLRVPASRWHASFCPRRHGTAKPHAPPRGSGLHTKFRLPCPATPTESHSRPLCQPHRANEASSQRQPVTVSNRSSSETSSWPAHTH